MGSCFSKHSSSKGLRHPDSNRTSRPDSEQITAKQAKQEEGIPPATAFNPSISTPHEAEINRKQQCLGDYPVSDEQCLGNSPVSDDPPAARPNTELRWRNIEQNDSNENAPSCEAPIDIVFLQQLPAMKDLPAQRHLQGGQQFAKITHNQEEYIPDRSLEASRTNSMSRSLSVEQPRFPRGAQPSSPSKRLPSNRALSDAPCLLRTSSAKVSSPSKGGAGALIRTAVSTKAKPAKDHSLSASVTYKRSASRDCLCELSARTVRRPSPPKKTLPTASSPSALSSRDVVGKLIKQPSKENSGMTRPVSQKTGGENLNHSGRFPVQRNIIPDDHELNNSLSNRNVRRREKSPLRRTCQTMVTLQGSTITSAAPSSNSDTISIHQADSNSNKNKNVAVQRRNAAQNRMPLHEISDITISQTKRGDLKLDPHKTVGNLGKENESKAVLECPASAKNKEHVKKAPLEMETGKGLLDFADIHGKDPLEAKAESLVLEGKSVLGAFKALEEYRLKSLDSLYHMDGDAAAYSCLMPTYSTIRPSQPFQPGLEDSELPRSSSAKRSCEPFLFPDVQSLLLQEDGLQFAGTEAAMSASLSKACSILRAVADLNLGASIQPQGTDSQDEIECPNLLSFQFECGESAGELDIG